MSSSLQVPWGDYSGLELTCQGKSALCAGIHRQSGSIRQVDEAPIHALTYRPNRLNQPPWPARKGGKPLLEGEHLEPHCCLADIYSVVNLPHLRTN
jgi:hypothetical protein